MPPPRGPTGVLFTLLFLFLSLLATYSMRLSPAVTAVSLTLETTVRTLRFPSTNFPLRERYTGILPLDFGLRFLVTAFLPGVGGWDPKFQIQQLYFLLSFWPVIAIWSIEAGRRGGKGRRRWTSYTSLWALFYQTIGGAIIIPLYYLFYMRESSSADYYTPASVQVPAPYAKALLPSLVLGYLLPTLAMFAPFPGGDTDLRLTQGLIAFWQITPLVVNLLLVLFSTAYSKSGPSTREKSPRPPLEDGGKHLNRLYLTLLLLSSATHILILGICLSSPQLSLSSIFFLVPLPHRLTLTGGLHTIFQADFLIIFAAALAGAFLAMSDLKRISRTDLSLWEVAGGMLLGTVVVGPGATLVGVWWVREGVMRGEGKS